MPSVTAERPLPGAEQPPDFQRLAADFRLPPHALERIWRRLGSTLRVVLAGAAPDDLAPVCRAEAVTPAEIRHAVLAEGCRTLEDLHRHTHLGAGPCDGLDCAAAAVQLMAELADWPARRARDELAGFLQRRWTARRPVLGGATLAQEEVLRGVYGPAPGMQ